MAVEVDSDPPRITGSAAELEELADAIELAAALGEWRLALITPAGVAELVIERN